MKNKKTILTDEQKINLHKLWETYGNNGINHSLTGHKFIQSLLENLEFRMRNDSFNKYFFKIKKFYRLRKTDKLYKDVYAIVKNCL